MVSDLLDEPRVMAGLRPSLMLEDGFEKRPNQPASRDLAGGLELHQEPEPLGLEDALPGIDDGADQLVTAAEVVPDRRAVSLAGSGNDLAERDRRPLLRNQPFGGLDEGKSSGLQAFSVHRPTVARSNCNANAK